MKPKTVEMAQKSLWEGFNSKLFIQPQFLVISFSLPNFVVRSFMHGKPISISSVGPSSPSLNFRTRCVCTRVWSYVAMLKSQRKRKKILFEDTLILKHLIGERFTGNWGESCNRICAQNCLRPGDKAEGIGNFGLISDRAEIAGKGR